MRQTADKHGYRGRFFDTALSDCIGGKPMITSLTDVLFIIKIFTFWRIRDGSSSLSIISREACKVELSVFAFPYANRIRCPYSINFRIFPQGICLQYFFCQFIFLGKIPINGIYSRCFERHFYVSNWNFFTLLYRTWAWFALSVYSWQQYCIGYLLFSW